MKETVDEVVERLKRFSSLVEQDYLNESNLRGLYSAAWDSLEHLHKSGSKGHWWSLQKNATYSLRDEVMAQVKKSMLPPSKSITIGHSGSRRIHSFLDVKGDKDIYYIGYDYVDNKAAQLKVQTHFKR
jgi:hypothetical protein